MGGFGQRETRWPQCGDELVISGDREGTNAAGGRWQLDRCVAMMVRPVWSQGRRWRLVTLWAFLEIEHTVYPEVSSSSSVLNDKALRSPAINNQLHFHLALINTWPRNPFFKKCTAAMVLWQGGCTERTWKCCHRNQNHLQNWVQPKLLSTWNRAPFHGVCAGPHSLAVSAETCTWESTTCFFLTL